MSNEDFGAALVKDAFKFLDQSPEKEPKQYFPTSQEGEASFHVSPYEKKEADPEEEENLKVLEPEHPLLERFQRALKQHLEKQIDYLRNEILEYETAAKKKQAEKDQLGVDAYETQQIVSKQQTDLENSVTQLKNIIAAREENEVKLHAALDEHKNCRDKLFETEKKEIELRKEIDSLNLLVQQMSSWEGDIESELKLNQRMFEKTKKDKAKLAEEKRQQDMLVYKLMTEVWDLEAELETMLMQLRVKEEEREKLAETIAISNTDIEAAESEHRCLLHGWHSVIIAISNRDKHFNQVTQELTIRTEKLRSILSEIEQVKKLSQREMNINEQLTMFKNRIESDLGTARHQLEVEENKRDNLERSTVQTQAIVDQIENDISRVINENRIASSELVQLTKEYEKTLNEKITTEARILENIRDQITSDKACRYLSKLLYDLKVKNRAMEIALGNTENRNATVLMDVECQKGTNDELARTLAELRKQQAVVDKQILGYNDEINKCYSSVNKKQREIELLTNKLEKIRSGDNIKSPHELKISALEQHIEHVQEKNKDLQKFWLREQGHVVCLSEQREEQIHDSNLLRKQTLILEQRNLKINDELDVHHKQEEKMQRNINKLQNQLVYFTEALSKKKGSKDCLDASNCLLHDEFIIKLRHEELEIVKAETDIVDIENDINRLSVELLDQNREALEWEKKYKMVLETKNNINEEKGVGGEVTAMRTEIHRMNVRYSQLRKAQDKLIADLEHCVFRRDAIATVAEAREKRLGDAMQSKVVMHKKLDDLRNKIKTYQSEIEDVNRGISDVEYELKLSQDQMIMKESDIETARFNYLETQREMEVIKTDKQLKLEMLLMQQRRYKMYTELAKGRQPFLMYKTDTKLQSEYQYQLDLRNKLQRIVDDLSSDYPFHYETFQRISNTLKLSTIPTIPS
ncbi:coiled-coil domain-containing protein 40 [Holotrichia oblita]|uniref:Coiled-coil domain-containing protein 40 n=1 Tax=Holotrichia oblita TaxID=644536 RepID=A0ACB9SLT9_HOLOL|nr:coiled-coil domain-containing protein 40 [Holotrichia oblita]